MKPSDSVRNVLLIMTDQQRFDTLRSYGFTGGHTPNLDRLASQGVLFERCYVNNTICTPSRASLFTGRPLPGHRVYRLHDNLSEDLALFPAILRRHGYETALFGKLHTSSAAYEARQRHPGDGFDHYEYCVDPYMDLDGSLNGYADWLKENQPDFYTKLVRRKRRIGNFPEEVHVARWTADRTIHFFKTRNAEKPFFCYTSFFDPHDPYHDYPVAMNELVDADAIPAVNRRNGETASKPLGIRREHEESYVGPYHKYSDEQIARWRVGYHRSIAFVDQQIGRVIDTLREQGLEENTLVIFLSDHGDMLGDHELLAKGAFFYDPCTRVPLIIRYPDRTNAGKRMHQLVQPHDVASTVLSWAGVENDGSMPDSIDLTSLIAGECAERGYAVCVYRGSGMTSSWSYFDPPVHCTMFRENRYKLNVYHSPTGSGEAPEGELYDMVEDPGENSNLWNHANCTHIQAELLGRLANWLVEQDLRYAGGRPA